MEVGGWWRLAVGGSRWLAVPWGGPQGRSLKKKKLVPKGPPWVQAFSLGMTYNIQMDIQTKRGRQVEDATLQAIVEGVSEFTSISPKPSSMET